MRTQKGVRPAISLARIPPNSSVLPRPPNILPQIPPHRSGGNLSFTRPSFSRRLQAGRADLEISIDSPHFLWRQKGAVSVIDKDAEGSIHFVSQSNTGLLQGNGDPAGGA